MLNNSINSCQLLKFIRKMKNIYLKKSGPHVEQILSQALDIEIPRSSPPPTVFRDRLKMHENIPKLAHSTVFSFILKHSICHKFIS